MAISILSLPTLSIPTLVIIGILVLFLLIVLALRRNSGKPRTERELAQREQKIEKTQKKELRWDKILKRHIRKENRLVHGQERDFRKIMLIESKELLGSRRLVYWVSLISPAVTYLANNFSNLGERKIDMFKMTLNTSFQRLLSQLQNLRNDFFEERRRIFKMHEKLKQEAGLELSDKRNKPREKATAIKGKVMAKGILNQAGQIAKEKVLAAKQLVQERGLLFFDRQQSEKMKSQLDQLDYCNNAYLPAAIKLVTDAKENLEKGNYKGNSPNLIDNINNLNKQVINIESSIKVKDRFSHEIEATILMKFPFLTKERREEWKKERLDRKEMEQAQQQEAQ